ncbi:hypothetical protein V865_003296 [Kwoniella europaea PYCC6329]|uniref:Uncharacterized protein n=1 Tax=Kwoniella europaea PYCC6329 TaxID=1423913 RepID=A0AAX4KHH8_9TREE
MTPETRGISLEEVDELYRTKVPAWRSNSWVPSSHHAIIDEEGARRHSESAFVANGLGSEKEKKITQQHVENAQPNEKLPRLQIRMGQAVGQHSSGTEKQSLSLEL